jgi:pimeloyl-ACP methyl ester carboxylesterase
MATFVLVHGAWAGGWAWKRVARLLRATGHDVYTPTLTGLGERSHLATPTVNLDTHVLDIVNVLSYEDLQHVVLVGWSYSGMVITGVIDRVPERLAHAVYLDAELPRDGESEFDVSGPEFRAEMEQAAQTMGNGWKASVGTVEDTDAFFKTWLPDEAVRHWFVAKLVTSPQPIETFRQGCVCRNPAADSVPRSFIRCPIDGEVWASIYDPIVKRVRQDPRWQVRELPSNHLAPIVVPELVASMLEDIAKSFSV